MIQSSEILSPAVCEGLSRHGSILRAVREAAGIDVHELARLTGLDPARISYFESTPAWPMPLEADDLAFALGVPVDFLLD